MTTRDEKSLSDEVTFTGQTQPRPASEVSIGDERTLGDNISGQDAVIEVIDLEARYRVEGTLGQGGMGAVLLATDTRLDRKVAIKRILGEAAANRLSVLRFLTEAKSIAALNHPNIVQIYDYGRAKDGPFLIMEHVAGGSLLDKCHDGALPLEEAVAMACQLCDGLAKAHDLGIIHRDIKPANVLLTKDGIPKLTDFGLAKAQSGDHGQTMTGAVLGTPDFMPPEQRKDAALVDHRSDLWSLAATLYQMVTGRSPKIIRFDLLPPGLTSVLGKALEESKEDRYQSAREFRDALKTPRGAAGRSEESTTATDSLNETPQRSVIAPADIGVCPTGAGILDVGAEGLCYSANDNLVFGNGASGAVLRAAGPKLRQAAARVIRDKGPIPVGSCAMTDSYDLVQAGCRKIFHLVTLAYDPLRLHYETGREDYLGDISRAVSSACHLATEAGLSSLALPQIGTRVNTLSAATAAAAVVRGVHAFLLKETGNTTIRRFHLCAFHSDPALRSFAKQVNLIRYQYGDILTGRGRSRFSCH
jgi:O-acetyl-ADP-ribose deacetylase (regulator of RNase III)